MILEKSKIVDLNVDVVNVNQKPTSFADLKNETLFSSKSWWSR